MCPVIHNTYIRWSLPHGKLWVVLHQWNTIQKPKLINNNWRAYRCFRKSDKEFASKMLQLHRWPQFSRRHAFLQPKCRPERELPHPPKVMPPFPENSLFQWLAYAGYMGIQTPCPRIGTIQKSYSSSRVPLGIHWGLLQTLMDIIVHLFSSAQSWFPYFPHRYSLPGAFPVKFLKANIHWRLFPKKFNL